MSSSVTVCLNLNHHKSGLRNYSIVHEGLFDMWIWNSTTNCRMNLIAAAAYQFMAAVLQAAESICIKL